VVPDVAEPSPFPRGPQLLVGLATDVGKTRPGEQNEDSLGVFSLTLGIDSRLLPVVLAIVADGMGGHASGQEASRLVVRTVTDYVLRQLALPFLAGDVNGNEPDEMLQGLLFEAARAANVALCQENDAQAADSGSTLVAALVVDHTAYIVNVGDSRAYVLGDGELRRITTDHSLVEQLIAGGIITAEERYTHPQRNKIFKSLGDDAALQPDTFVQRLQPGTRLLLCCDGAWELVHDDQIARLLGEIADPQQAADAIVARANENGGEDNISAIVLEARA
jgi:serine/threonine protein phosphatase PrpC